MTQLETFPSPLELHELQAIQTWSGSTGTLLVMAVVKSLSATKLCESINCRLSADINPNQIEQSDKLLQEARDYETFLRILGQIQEQKMHHRITIKHK